MAAASAASSVSIKGFEVQLLTGLTKLRVLLAALMLAGIAAAGGPGFTTQRHLDEHYSKHGSEFGHITKAEYLRLAQELRDAPAGGPILEVRRADGAVTRF